MQEAYFIDLDGNNVSRKTVFQRPKYLLRDRKKPKFHSFSICGNNATKTFRTK